MTLRPPRARRRPPRGLVRASAIVAVALVAASCSGGDDTAAGDPVPTLLTAPVQSSTTSSTSTTTTSTTLAVDDRSTTAAPATPASAPATISTTGDPGVPSGPGTPADASSSTVASTASGSSVAGGATTTAGATSTTADIEPPPPSVTSTQPIPTAPQPPDTTGGTDVDFLLGPKAIAGLQFGASRATVLDRLRTLLGDPLRVDTLADCAGGPATALQWFNAAVIITDRGLAYYTVGMNLDDYQDMPVPGWHTAAGLRVGADRAFLEATYPQQLTYGAPADRFTPFTVSAGADAGLAGRLDGEVVGSVSAGTASC